MRKLIVMAIVAAALMGTGCERTWNAANRSALKEDIASLLAQCDLHGRVPEKCSMIGATRDGRCEVDVTPEEIAQFVDRLGLEMIDQGNPDHRAVLTRLTEASPAFFEHEGAEGLEAWVAFGRPPTLRLKSGTAFENLLVVYSPLSARACLLVSYAYG